MATATEQVLDRALDRVSKLTPPGDPSAVVPARLDQIAPDSAQPRQDVDDELAASIAEHGVLQPITVRNHPVGNGDKMWMIVDGERRWRGAKKAGLDVIGVIVRHDVDDEATRIVRQSVANTGKPLMPMEEAKAWKRVQELTGMNAAQLAKVLGRPKSTVGDRLALAEAPEAFHPLFANGVLSAAAAPIVRQFADVPNKTLERAVQLMSDSWEFEQAAQQEHSVAIKTAQRIIENTICYNVMREIPKEIEKEFRGLVIDLKGRKYTPEVEAITKLAQDVAARDRTTPAKVRQPSAHSEAERKRVRESRKKAALRRAQFDAIGAKLPEELDTKWLLFVAQNLAGEMSNDGRRLAVKALGLEVKKGKYSPDYHGTITGYAASLKAAELTKLIVRLLLASDLYVSPNSSSGPRRLPAAAALAKVDLKKVKLPDPAPKKLAARFRGAPDFMKPCQPDAVLGAIVGNSPLVRTEITKKLWQYIKKNGLQDAKERRMINADVKLKPLFGGKKKVSMFEMTKLVGKHFKVA